MLSVVWLFSSVRTFSHSMERTLAALVPVASWKTTRKNHRRGRMTRKLRTDRFHGRRVFRSVPAKEEETQSSDDRPPSRLRAKRGSHGTGGFCIKAAASSASVTGDAHPSHQRYPPSHRRKVRALAFRLSSPLTTRPRSISKGPACMRLRMAADSAFASADLRTMDMVPNGSSRQSALPKDDALFQVPVVVPSAITRPRGVPSGVKNPAFTAAIPPSARAAAAASWNSEPGPCFWSTTRIRWLRASNATPCQTKSP